MGTHYDPNNPTFERICEDNLKQIFKLLPRMHRLKAEQVCKRWNYVARNYCWSDYQIFDNLGCEDENLVDVKKILTFFEKRCGTHLRHLTLRKWPARHVLKAMSWTANLQHLRLWGVSLGSSHLRKMVKLLPELKSLHLRDSLTNDDFEAGLTAFFKAATSLEYLHLYEVSYKFNRYKLTVLPANLRYLELDIENAEKILAVATARCKHLMGIKIKPRWYSLSHVVSGKSLTYMWLNLGYCSFFTHDLKDLQTIRALEILEPDIQTMETFAKNLKLLEHITLKSSRSYESLRSLQILHHWPVLRSIDVTLDCSIRNEDISAIIAQLGKEGRLEYLQIALRDRRYLLPLKDIKSLILGCKKLRYLNCYTHLSRSHSYECLCQMVDEIDGLEARTRVGALASGRETLDIYCGYFNGSVWSDYKWLRFVQKKIPPGLLEQWQYGSLSAGKPDWVTANLPSDT